MHSGLPKKSFLSQWGIIFSFAILACITFGCKDEDKISLTFSAPDQGQNFNTGDEIKIKLDAPKDAKISSVVYLLDSTVISTKNNADSVLLPTKELPLGYKMITAIVTQGEKKDTITTNIVLKSNFVPVKLSYKVVNSFPHDTSAYTEGLAFIDGKLLESTGENGASELKWVDLQSGKTIQKTKLEPQYFGEGSLKIGDKIIMLTWKENIGFIFDAKTFKQIGTFPYERSREGWGLTFDGKNILRTDGTNRVWKMNAITFKEEGYIEVYDEKGAVDSLNELEFIDGKIYANVYQTNKIVVINPNSGRIEAELDLTALVPQNFFKTDDERGNNVLNGIAWDAKGKRLFVGGKKWPKLYEIKLNDASAK